MNNQNEELKMLESICKELGIPNFLEVLSTTPMRRLQPLLIHACKKRAEMRRPADLLKEYEGKQEFFGISTIAQDELQKFTQICHRIVKPVFEVVQTSPIAPLGLNAILSRVSQNNTMSSLRNAEVVSDTTTQLALECAIRRKKALLERVSSKENIVNLCTSSRVLRLQPFDKTKGYMQHFNLFALCSGGINSEAAGGFAVPVLQIHILTLLNIFEALRDINYKCNNITVRISDMRFLDQLIDAQKIPREVILRNSLNDDFDLFKEYKLKFPREVWEAKNFRSEMFTTIGLKDRTKYFRRIEERITAPLREKHPNVRFCFDFTRKSGLGYYPHLCFHIFAKNHTSNVIQLADGGAVDWLAKLLGNTHEAMVASGIGSELMQKLFYSKT